MRKKNNNNNKLNRQSKSRLEYVKKRKKKKREKVTSKTTLVEAEIIDWLFESKEIEKVINPFAVYVYEASVILFLCSLWDEHIWMSLRVAGRDEGFGQRKKKNKGKKRRVSAGENGYIKLIISIIYI